MPTCTANSFYEYNKIYYGKTLCEWVNLAHKENCVINKWEFVPLNVGQFGFDNIACSLVYCFKHLQTTTKGDKDVIIEELVNYCFINYIIFYIYCLLRLKYGMEYSITNG